MKLRSVSGAVLASGGVEVFEATQSGFDLAVAVELVSYLGGQLGDLIRDMVQTHVRAATSARRCSSTASIREALWIRLLM